MKNINGVNVSLAANGSKKSIDNAKKVSKAYPDVLRFFEDILNKQDNKLTPQEKKVKKEITTLLKYTTDKVSALKRIILYYQENKGTMLTMQWNNIEWDNKVWNKKDLLRSQTVLMNYTHPLYRDNDRIKYNEDSWKHSWYFYYKKVLELLSDDDPEMIDYMKKKLYCPVFVVAAVLEKLWYNEYYDKYDNKMVIKDSKLKDNTSYLVRHPKQVNITGIWNKELVFSKDLLRAILLFQSENNLDVDGLWWVRFFAKLYQQMLINKKNNVTKFEEPEIKINKTGSKIKDLPDIKIEPVPIIDFPDKKSPSKIIVPKIKKDEVKKDKRRNRKTKETRMKETRMKDISFVTYDEYKLWDESSIKKPKKSDVTFNVPIRDYRKMKHLSFDVISKRKIKIKFLKNSDIERLWVFLKYYNNGEYLKKYNDVLLLFSSWETDKKQSIRSVKIKKKNNIFEISANSNKKIPIQKLIDIWVTWVKVWSSRWWWRTQANLKWKEKMFYYRWKFVRK